MFYARTGRLLDVIRAYALVQAKAMFLQEHPAYQDHLAEIYVEMT